MDLSYIKIFKTNAFNICVRSFNKIYLKNMLKLNICIIS